MPPRQRKPVELWERAPHTGAKHELLRYYMGAWYAIMSTTRSTRFVYYDAFGGPGRYKGGEDGSPIIALKALVEHNGFGGWASKEFVLIFNEQDPGCAEHLQGLVDAYKAANQPWPSNVHVSVDNRTFVDLTTEIIDELDASGARLAPTFAFIDPVGVKYTPIDVVKRLTKSPKCELLIYFAHDAVLRWCGSGKIDDRLTALFGNEDYKGAASLTGADRSQYLNDLYKQRLHDECGFPYIQSFAMYEDRGKRVYDLFYCTHEPLGLDRMKQAMWKVAPSGTYTFEDRFAGQDVLFGAGEDVDTQPLQDHLCEHFAGQAVGIQTIVDHVIVATPYHSSHVKKRTLVPLQKAGRITSPNQARSNQYPPGTIVQFPPK
jgi:three-Cys-motif partner protein